MGSAAADSVAERYCQTVLSSASGLEELTALARRAATDPDLHTAVKSPMLLRPMFLTREERDELERDLGALQSLLLSLPERLYDGDVASMCDELGFTATQTMLVEETWQDTDVLLSRADVIRGSNGFRVVEFNLHSSLGGLDNGPWHRAFLDVPMFAETARQENLTFVDPMDGVAGAVRAGARTRGLGSFPTIAIVDWPTSYAMLIPRLKRLSAMFGRRGLDAFHCHAGELGLRGGKLHARGRRIDVIYRVFLIEDVLESPALVAPIIAAHRSGNVALAMGFIAELVGNKGCLAMLHDRTHAGVFTAAERDLIDRVVPRTDWVRSAPATAAGVDSCDLLSLPQEELILKPAGGYSARGITAGWLSDPASWRSAVATARDRPWVLQRRVRPVPELVPVVTQGSVGLQDVDVNWGVFLAGDRFNGAMIRATQTADHELITTSTGAAVSACFIERA